MRAAREICCRRCGYSLRGLRRVYGQCFCPECDTVTWVEPKPRRPDHAARTTRPSRWRELRPLAIMCAPLLAAAILISIHPRTSLATALVLITPIAALALPFLVSLVLA